MMELKILPPNGRTTVEPLRKLAKDITTSVVTMSVPKVTPFGEPSPPDTSTPESTRLPSPVRFGPLILGMEKLSQLR
jgi:hypothetical protein